VSKPKRPAPFTSFSFLNFICLSNSSLISERHMFLLDMLSVSTNRFTGLVCSFIRFCWLFHNLALLLDFDPTKFFLWVR
jgi:hypothetical protein